MKHIKNIFTIFSIALLSSKSFATGPTVALIASDKSSHVCKIGVYAGWDSLSGTNMFNKLVKFKSEIFQNTKEVTKFKSEWLNYTAGFHAGYTRFFNRMWGWNVLDVKGGYSQYATFKLEEVGSKKDNNKEAQKNTFTYRGFSADVMTGLAINFLEDGLDFEEGNQFGNRLVLNVNVGANFNFRNFHIDGDPTFKATFLDAHFADTTLPFRLVVEPSLEFVARCGFLSKLGINVGFFGPWKGEKNNEAEYSLKENQIEKLGHTISLAPIVEFGWDFSALINK